MNEIKRNQRSKKISKRVINASQRSKSVKTTKRTKKDLEFEKYLERVEDPNYDGADASWDLPENPTPLERAKYELCEKMLIYQQDKNLTDEEIAQKIKLTTGETREILYCHIDYFTLDRLITYATRLFKPLEIKMVVAPKKARKVARIRAI